MWIIDGSSLPQLKARPAKLRVQSSTRFIDSGFASVLMLVTWALVGLVVGLTQSGHVTITLHP